MGAEPSRLSPAVRAFDRLAARYDGLVAGELFRAMREATHAWLAAAFAPGARVLEVGCGTGIDTAFLAARGVDVVAADPSAEMIARARARLDAADVPGRVRFICCGVDEVDRHVPPGLRFAGLVSNFGALNCVAALAPFAALAAGRVEPAGRVLVGVMSRSCLVEILWFALCGDFARAVRRLRRPPVAIEVEGVAVPTYYHRVGDLRRALAPALRLRRVRALGLLLPPPYLEGPWRGVPRPLRRTIAGLDARLSSVAPFNRLGDHVLLEFVRRP